MIFFLFRQVAAYFAKEIDPKFGNMPDVRADKMCNTLLRLWVSWVLGPDILQ